MSAENDQQVRDVLARYVGTKRINQNSYIFRDLGITGGDWVELLDELEARFDINLRPLIEQGPREESTLTHSLFAASPRRSGVDVTVGELVEFITASKRN